MHSAAKYLYGSVMICAEHKQLSLKARLICDVTDVEVLFQEHLSLWYANS